MAVIYPFLSGENPRNFTFAVNELSVWKLNILHFFAQKAL